MKKVDKSIVKVVLDDTAKEQLNIAIVGIKFICDLFEDCADGCPFCTINEDSKIPKCKFYSIPEQWDTIK